MAVTSILCFPISGDQHHFFLLKVASRGPRPLDLKLVGSEGVAVFVAKLQHKQAIGYKAEPGHCTDEEWQQILISTLVDMKPLPDIEVKADVHLDRQSVALSFRQNIQGITQRLGSIDLFDNDKLDISPFDWCVTAIASRTKVIEELADASAKITSLEDSVNKLQAQLEEFVATKEEDETQLVEKFRDLLNKKKDKIRQQQRLLAAAKVDPEELANPQGNEAAHRNAGPSRSGKRKAAIEEGDDESDDGFERMEVDNDNNQQSTDNDATTASETDTHTDGDADPTPYRITKPTTSAGKQKAQPIHNTRAAKQKQSTAVSSSRVEDEDEDEAPPPPRALPFRKGKRAAPPPKPADDDETQSDDDSEL
ncbi:hypothetical protein GGR50DRAFT_59955 [Xylaria sp. CBS 124048]|nr:hypothetical protein GGR50DRAFT_59955 [Xylaria sp. CBS 124048]